MMMGKYTILILKLKKIVIFIAFNIQQHLGYRCMYRSKKSRGYATRKMGCEIKLSKNHYLSQGKVLYLLMMQF